MGSIWGKNIKISIFGESHSTAVGVTIDGLPSGVNLNFDEINHQIWRRKTIDSSISTPRQESDEFEILSGYFNNHTTGSPLSAIFKNQNCNPNVYEPNMYIPRPGTADLTAAKKYSFFNDYRGGGHFSARLTLGLVFAGNICYQILKKKFDDIVIGSHVSRIYNKKSKEKFDKCNINIDLLHKLSLEYFPVIDSQDKKEFIKLIKKFKEEGNTVGGEIEVAIINLPPGIGSPLFDNFESKISSLIYSIPAVKVIDFGLGITNLDGYNANDDFFYDDNLNVVTKSNNHNGILGGISSGMPIILRIGFKPIPSIKLLQNTVNLKTKENIKIKISGNHDITPVVRAAPIIEGAIAIAILDLLYDKK